MCAYNRLEVVGDMTVRIKTRVSGLILNKHTIQIYPSDIL